MLRLYSVRRVEKTTSQLSIPKASEAPDFITEIA
jgi:hypothetical protein